jgi:hypothetical protein
MIVPFALIHNIKRELEVRRFRLKAMHTKWPSPAVRWRFAALCALGAQLSVCEYTYVCARIQKYLSLTRTLLCVCAEYIGSCTRGHSRWKII